MVPILFMHLISVGTFILELIKSHFFLKISVTVFYTVTHQQRHGHSSVKAFVLKNLKKGPSFALLITRPPTVTRKNTQTNVT